MSEKSILNVSKKAELSRKAQIIFDSWDIGFHGYNPGHIHISSQAQGMEILRVLASATNSHHGVYARMLSKHGKVSYWHICDEEVWKVEPEDYCDQRWSGK